MRLVTGVRAGDSGVLRCVSLLYCGRGVVAAYGSCYGILVGLGSLISGVRVVVVGVGIGGDLSTNRPFIDVRVCGLLGDTSYRLVGILGNGGLVGNRRRLLVTANPGLLDRLFPGLLR